MELVLDRYFAKLQDLLTTMVINVFGRAMLKIYDVKNHTTNKCLTVSGRSRLPSRLSVIIINDAYFNKSSLLLLRTR